jgi:hypothetical protein
MVPFAASLYAVGPLIAFGVIAGLAAILRWAFDADVARTREKIFNLSDYDDYGLLSVAGVAQSVDDAQIARELLASAGIRATTAVMSDGRVRILVFRSEVEQARRVVGDSAL